MRHRRLVHLLEIDVRQQDGGIRVQHLRDGIARRNAIRQLAIAPEGVATNKLCAHFSGEYPVRRTIRQFRGDQARQAQRWILAGIRAEGAERAQSTRSRQVERDRMQPTCRTAEKTQPEQMRQVGVAPVAGEYFISAVALQNHLCFTAQLFAEHVQRYVCGVAEGLVVASNKPLHDAGHGCPGNAHLVVFRIEVLGDRARHWKFVGAVACDGIETDRVGVDPTAVVLGGKGDDG